MKFEQFLNALDIGHCQDQQQREALFDLVLLFVIIDGVVAYSEMTFMKDWLATIKWNNELSKDEYYDVTLAKCKTAQENEQVEDFIAHRCKLLVDPQMKEQALKLARDIVMVDGELDENEAKALAFLEKELAD